MWNLPKLNAVPVKSGTVLLTMGLTTGPSHSGIARIATTGMRTIKTNVQIMALINFFMAFQIFIPLPPRLF